MNFQSQPIQLGIKWENGWIEHPIPVIRTGPNIRPDENQVQFVVQPRNDLVGCERAVYHRCLAEYHDSPPRRVHTDAFPMCGQRSETTQWRCQLANISISPEHSRS